MSRISSTNSRVWAIILRHQARSFSSLAAESRARSASRERAAESLADLMRAGAAAASRAGVRAGAAGDEGGALEGGGAEPGGAEGAGEESAAGVVVGHAGLRLRCYSNGGWGQTRVCLCRRGE